MKPIPKYKLDSVNTENWEDIESFYLKLIFQGWELEPMIDLVRHIKEKELSKRLFPYTSLDKLVITIYDNPAEVNRECLHIRYDRPTRMWHFYYVPKPYGQSERIRSYTKEKGIEKLRNMLRHLNGDSPSLTFI